MKIKITAAMLAAAGRHVVSYSAGFATAAAGVATIAYNLHAVSPEQAAQLTDAARQLADGVKSVWGALATLSSVAAAAWATYRSTQTSQAKAAASVPGSTVVTSPDIAAATPDHPNVVSNLTATVVRMTQ